MKSTKNQQHTSSEKGKSNLQRIGINKFINVFIILSVIIGAIAPFLHIFFSKESTDKIVGFNNMRSFLFAIGLPVSLFVISLFVAFMSNLLELRAYKKSIQVSSLVFISIALYFIIWTFWYRDDFDIYLYYTFIGVISISSAYVIYNLLKISTQKLKALHSVSEKIPKLESDIEYVNGIADLMPENEDTVTYKAMLDTTGDDLRETYIKIKKDLQLGAENSKILEGKKS